MGVLSRLRDFTADRDATPPIAISAEGMDNEFDQVIAESNSQNTRLGTNETRLTALEAPGNVSTADLAADSVTPEKTSFVDDTLVATDTHIMVGDGTDFGNVAVSGDATIANTGVITISADAVTTAKVLNANVTLEKLQNSTATNKILGRVSTGSGSYEEVDLQTTLSSTDEAIPTSKAVRDDIISLVNDVGGFVAVADDQSFPNANPDPDDGAGTVVSIADAGGLVVNGSGVTTTGKTLGGTTVTISGIPSIFFSTTVASGLGMQVITSTTLNTYTYHRITAKEDEINTVATNITNVNHVGTNITNVGLIAGQISPTNNISTLGGINSDITTVSGIASDVTTVSSANSNISTCATNINGINSFGERYRVGGSDPSNSLDQGDLFFNTSTNELKAYGTSWQNTAPNATDQANINIVAGDVIHTEDLGLITEALTAESGNGDITTCASNISNINNLANGITNVNLVGNSIVNVNTTATNIASINTTAGITTPIVNVSNVASAVSTVSGISSEVTNVSGKTAEVTLLGTSTVVGNLGHVGTAQAVSDLGVCATNISDIGAVAGDATDIGVVAGLSSTLTAVNNNSANINAVNSNSANINVVAGISAGVSFFTDRYRVAANAPTTSLDSGDLWWDETNSELRAYSGSAWQSTAPSAVNQTHINNVSGALVYEDDLGSIADALNTSSSTGDIATVSTNIDAINKLGTTDCVSDMNLLASTAIVDDMNLLASQAVIDDMALLSTQAVVDDMALLSTQAVVDDLAILGSTAVVNNLAIVATNVADINRYSDEYTISGSAPSSPSAGDLWMDTSANVLKYYTGSTFASIISGIAELVQDTSPELGAALDCLNNNISNCGTLDGSNLQIDFGGLT